MSTNEKNSEINPSDDPDRFRKYYVRNTPFSTPLATPEIHSKNSAYRSNNNKNNHGPYPKKSKQGYEYNRKRSKSRTLSIEHSRSRSRSRKGKSKQQHKKSRKISKSPNKHIYASKTRVSETKYSQETSQNQNSTTTKYKSTTFTPLYFKGTVDTPKISKDEIHSKAKALSKHVKKPFLFSEEFQNSKTNILIDYEEDDLYISKKSNFNTFKSGNKLSFEDEYSALEWENFDRNIDRQWYDKEEGNLTMDENNAYFNIMGGSLIPKEDDEDRKKKLSILKPISKKTINIIDNNKWEINRMLNSGTIKEKKVCKIIY